MNNKEKRESIAKKCLEEKFGTSEYKTVLIEAQDDRQINYTTHTFKKDRRPLAGMAKTGPSDLHIAEYQQKIKNSKVLTIDLDD